MRIHSIGHSKLPIGRFIGLLAERGVGLLVDIRSVPFSRFAPQFNKERLRSALEAAGLGYLFLGEELGGRIKDPDCFVGKVLPAEKAGMAAYVDYEVLKGKESFAAGIAKLLARAASEETAIMCSEEDPDKCHRKLLVGRRLAELGVEVIHIRSKAAGKQPELFDGGREGE